MLRSKALFLVLMAVFVAGFALAGDAIPNWSAPATWSPSRAAGVHTLTDVTNPLPFIGLAPCRIADTRAGFGFGGSYGPPPIAANTTRTFVIAGQCGVPVGAAAVSFNFAAANIPGLGDLRVFPAGGGVPLVSTINYNGSAPIVANAAIVPLGVGGGITVQADGVAIDLIIDVNGYYSSVLGDPSNVFILSNNSTAETMDLHNASTTCSSFCGILMVTASGTALWGESNSNGHGVFGQADATTGQWHGVFGKSFSGSLDTSGVYGKDGSAVLGPGCTGFSGCLGTAGVRGEGRNGVVGLTSGNVNNIGAVVGLFLDSGGVLGAFGELGYSFTTAVHGDGNMVITGTKSFVTPHPTDPGKEIDYVSLEGPEAGTYFRGTAQIVNGMAVIAVPDHFAMVTDPDGLTVQLTAVGAAASMYIASEDLNQIVVRSNRDVRFHYQVNGIRSAFKDHQPIAENTSFVPRSADTPMTGALAPEQKRALISNGTFNPDGTVNLQTATRMGWVKMWEDKAKAVETKQVAAGKQP